MNNAANYTKFITAAVGLTIIFVQRRWGVDLQGVSGPTEDILQVVFEAAGSLITAWSVYFFPNKPKVE